MSVLIPTKPKRPFWSPPHDKWTVDDYMRLPMDDGRKYELIDGKLHIMPPPETGHQIASGNLSAELHHFVKKNKLGRIFSAPTAVRINENRIVEPDIFFVSEENGQYILRTHVACVPEFIIEIVSPSNRTHDTRFKRGLYEEQGVEEYWLVDPIDKEVEIFVLRDEMYLSAGIYTLDDTIQSEVLPNFTIRVSDIFA